MSTILITGANRGLGLGFVRQALLRDKYTLILATTRSRDDGPGQPLDEDDLASLERNSGGRVRRVVLREVSDAASCQDMADEVKRLVPEGVNVLYVAHSESLTGPATQVAGRLLSGRSRPGRINNAGFANQPKPMTPLRLPTVDGALDYHRTWSVNAFGPLLVAATLLDNGVLRAPSDSSTSASAPSTTLTAEAAPAAEPTTTKTTTTTSYPTSLPSSLLLSSRPLTPAPVIANISSLQASLAWAAEMWTGGSARDELFFHPVYAASKAALGGVTLHMARVLRDEAIVGAIQPGWLKTTMGRTYATLTVDESAAKVLDIIDSWRTLRDSGQFVDEENRTIPW